MTHFARRIRRGLLKVEQLHALARHHRAPAGALGDRVISVDTSSAVDDDFKMPAQLPDSDCVSRCFVKGSFSDSSWYTWK
jgi:hypothetical protein